MRTLSIVSMFILAIALIALVSSINSLYAINYKNNEQVYIDWESTYAVDNYILRKEIK